jgi:hypothetical protein
VVTHCYRWPKFSAISGVSDQGKLYILVRPGTIATPQVLVFLRHLLRHIRGRIILIWDNINPHKAVAVKRFVLDNFAPRNLAELKIALRDAVQRIRMRPRLMRSFLEASDLSF